MMADYIVRTRKTSPWTEETVDANSREQAIQKVVEAAEEGEEVEVSTVVEAPPQPAEPAPEPQAAPPPG
jgi:hypothetical protein